MKSQNQELARKIEHLQIRVNTFKEDFSFKSSEASNKRAHEYRKSTKFHLYPSK